MKAAPTSRSEAFQRCPPVVVIAATPVLMSRFQGFGIAPLGTGTLWYSATAMVHNTREIVVDVQHYLASMQPQNLIRYQDHNILCIHGIAVAYRTVYPTFRGPTDLQQNAAQQPNRTPQSE